MERCLGYFSNCSHFVEVLVSNQQAPRQGRMAAEHRRRGTVRGVAGQAEDSKQQAMVAAAAAAADYFPSDPFFYPGCNIIQ